MFYSDLLKRLAQLNQTCEDLVRSKGRRCTRWPLNRGQSVGRSWWLRSFGNDQPVPDLAIKFERENFACSYDHSWRL